jgi:capsular polysaccharide export protein
VAIAVARPLLRSPPFLGVDGAVAAVSQPGRSTLTDPDRLFEAMRAARVGGAFWAADDPWTTAARTDADAAIIQWLAGADSSDRRAEAIGAIEAATYRDPVSGAPVDAHHAVATLAEWRVLFEANRPIVAAVGMAAWKREAIGRFLWDGREAVRFASASAALRDASSGAVAYWPSRAPEDFAARGEAANVATWPVEDGFLRSAGLGVECFPPMSIIIDRTGGVHFDPASESEIEMLLATYEFDRALLARAARLRERIVTARLGKYGVDRGAPPPALPDDRRIVLAIGQVEDDLSVLRGGGRFGTRDFLARVRACEPDAFIVYRPHPDVTAGLRQGDATGEGKADLVMTGGSLLALVERADSVHVVSSLTGFEALLRGAQVTVHGVPFYAGWGLTRDLDPVPDRRGRQLSLDALVAAALILAPRYLDPATGLPCAVEVLVERLASAGTPQPTLLSGFRRALGATRRTLRPAGQRA